MATQFGPATAFAIAAAAGVLYGLGVLALRLPAARPTTRTPISRSARCGMLLMALGLAISGVSWTPAVALISFGVSGMGMTLAFTSIITQIQDRSPDELRGRIMALWFVAFLGARPFAAGLNGVLADTVSVAMAVAAVILIGAAYSVGPAASSTPEAVHRRRVEGASSRPGRAAADRRQRSGRGPAGPAVTG